MKPEDRLLVAGVGLVLLSFGLVFYIVAAGVDLNPFAAGLVGSVMTISANIIGYYWGSSKGSADKTAMMRAPEPASAAIEGDK